LSSKRLGFLMFIVLFNFIFIFLLIFLLPFGELRYRFFIKFFRFSFTLSYFEFCFIFCLCIIFLNIFFWSYFYIKFYTSLTFFICLVISFVFSIAALITHSRGLVLMLGWDGLGVSSYLLVKFYNNWRSLNGAIVTILTNRLGDVWLFWVFVFLLFFSNFFVRTHIYPLFIFFFIFFCFTKRAQAPFSSWLPMAIRAPTPVRALVHSRTLVTAGIYLLIKYFYLFFGRGIRLIFWGFGGITLLVSGLVSLVEEDGKKIIALRTLNQLGFMVLGLGSGFCYLVFFHLLSHAFFKSCLFMQVGVFIYFQQRGQDLRHYSGGVYRRFLNFLILLICLRSLCGLGFTRGFIRKDLIISWELFFFFSFLYKVFIFFGVFFTFLYSFRILKGILLQKKNKIYFFGGDFFLFFTNILLLLFGIFFGGWFIWNVRRFPLGRIRLEKLFLFFRFFILFLVRVLPNVLSYLSGMCFQDSFVFSSLFFSILVPLKMNNFMDYLIILRGTSVSRLSLLVNLLRKFHFSLLFYLFFTFFIFLVIL